MQRIKGGRGITRKEKEKGRAVPHGAAVIYGEKKCFTFSVSDVDWHTGFQFCRPAVQATRPSNILFFQRQKGERESLEDASLLDKEDCWEFNYLPHVTCAH